MFIIIFHFQHSNILVKTHIPKCTKDGCIAKYTLVSFLLVVDFFLDPSSWRMIWKWGISNSTQFIYLPSSFFFWFPFLSSSCMHWVYGEVLSICRYNIIIISVEKLFRGERSSRVSSWYRFNLKYGIRFALCQWILGKCSTKKCFRYILLCHSLNAAGANNASME